MQPKPVGSPIPGKGMNVVAYLDATWDYLEHEVAPRMDDFKKAAAEAQDTLHCVSVLLRGGSDARSKIAKGLKKIGLPDSPRIDEALLEPDWVKAVGILFEGTSLDDLPREMIEKGLNWIQKGLSHRDRLRPEQWRGEEIHRIHGKEDSVIASDAEKMRPPLSAREFGEFLGSHLQPHLPNMAFVMGSGTGLKICNTPMDELHEGFALARQRSGITPEVLCMISCWPGNIMALHPLRNDAQVAIVSQERVDMDSFPVPEWLSQAAGTGGSASDIASGMVELHRLRQENEKGTSVKIGDRTFPMRTQTPRTLSAIDLSRIDLVKRSLIRLQAQLSRDPAKSTYVPQALERCRSKTGQPFLGDLGIFLDELHERGPVKDEVEEVRGHLEKAVIAHHHAPEFKRMSGLSFVIDSF